METYSAEVAARRAGVDAQEVVRLTDLGILAGSAGDAYTDADVRRVLVVQELERAGLPSDALASLVRDGRLSLDFLDDAGFRAFAAFGDETFAELSERTGIPIEVLTVLRDATGGKAAGPDDRVREGELEILPLVEYQMQLGFRPQAIERALRVYGDSSRRVAEAEAEWWRSEVQERVLADGGSTSAIAERAREITPRLSDASDRALMSIYHAQQTHVWLTNIVDGAAAALEGAGLRIREEKSPPAMCFLDVTGYTQLTQERGDAAAAALAEKLSRIVQRISVQQGGRPVKWLGDGVMFHFPDPGLGVVAAIEMVESLAAAGLPPAHVGLHAGPIIIQEGDFYGQTVNLAARIGEYARPGEVLVSRAVRERADASHIDFQPVGEVGLKGVSGLVELYSATRVL
jgi:adenylate cyclase